MATGKIDSMRYTGEMDARRNTRENETVVRINKIGQVDPTY